MPAGPAPELPQAPQPGPIGSGAEGAARALSNEGVQAGIDRARGDAVNRTDLGSRNAQAPLNVEGIDVFEPGPGGVGGRPVDRFIPPGPHPLPGSDPERFNRRQQGIMDEARWGAQVDAAQAIYDRLRGEKGVDGLTNESGALERLVGTVLGPVEKRAADAAFLDAFKEGMHIKDTRELGNQAQSTLDQVRRWLFGKMTAP